MAQTPLSQINSKLQGWELNPVPSNRCPLPVILLWYLSPLGKYQDCMVGMRDTANQKVVIINQGSQNLYIGS